MTFVLFKNVQRILTRLLPAHSHLCYEERLEKLNLTTLGLLYRRHRIDMIQAFKVIHNIDDIQMYRLFEFSDSQTRNWKKKNLELLNLLELTYFVSEWWTNGMIWQKILWIHQLCLVSKLCFINTWGNKIPNRRYLLTDSHLYNIYSMDIKESIFL